MVTGKTNRISRWLNHPDSEVDGTVGRHHPGAEPGRVWIRQMERFVGDYPLASVAAAATVGVLLGWLVKR